MKIHTVALIVLSSVALTACNMESKPPAAADNTTRNQDQYAPDNTGRNKQPGQATAENQSGAEMDRTITQQVRKWVVEERNLSVNGKNVKIITVDGVVTLNGPVNSPQERDTIGAMARKAPGVKSVQNNLEVTAPKNQ